MKISFLDLNGEAQEVDTQIIGDSMMVQFDMHPAVLETTFYGMRVNFDDHSDDHPDHMHPHRYALTRLSREDSDSALLDTADQVLDWLLYQMGGDGASWTDGTLERLKDIPFFRG